MYEKEPIKTEYLLLDPGNPRFVKTVEDAKRNFDLTIDDIQKIQEARKSELRKTVNYDVLLESIISHGYLDLDPIMVYPINDTDFYLVFEGNRRICAISDILNSTSALGKMNEEKINSLKELKCIVLREQNADLITKILGIRHLISVQQWESLQKALVIASLYTENKAPREIANATGETVARINRYLRVVALYNWIIENSIYGDNIKQNATIDIFMVAMSRSKVKEWFGYVENTDDLLQPEFSNPENVEKFAEWVAADIIVTGRFDVNSLNKILSQEDADEYLVMIEEGESPARIERELLSKKKGKWETYVKGAIKYFEDISANELESMSNREVELLDKLQKMISKIKERHRKLTM